MRPKKQFTINTEQASIIDSVGHIRTHNTVSKKSYRDNNT